MPFPFSHSPRSPRPSFWKGALQWVPAWSSEQLAALSPGLRGTRAQLWVVRGREFRVGRRSWGFRLEPALEPEPCLPPESSLGWGWQGLPARAGGFGRNGNVGKPAPTRNPRFHSCLDFPASDFPLDIRDAIQLEVQLETEFPELSSCAGRRRTFSQSIYLLRAGHPGLRHF